MNFIEYNKDVIKKKKLKKKNKLYWTLSIKINFEAETNKTDSFKSENSDLKELKLDYEKDVKHFINNNHTSERVKNCLNKYFEDLEFILSIKDFKKIKGIGKISIKKHELFFLELLEIIKNKYK